MKRIPTLCIADNRTWLLANNPFAAPGALRPMRMAAWFTNIYTYDDRYEIRPIQDWPTTLMDYGVNIGIDYEFEDLKEILAGLVGNAPGQYAYVGRVHNNDMPAARAAKLRLSQSPKWGQYYASSCAPAIQDLFGVAPDPSPTPEFFLGWFAAEDPVTPEIERWWQTDGDNHACLRPFTMPVYARRTIQVVAVDCEVEGLCLAVGDDMDHLSPTRLRAAFGETAILAAPEHGSAWRSVMSEHDLDVLRPIDRPLPFSTNTDGL